MCNLLMMGFDTEIMIICGVGAYSQWWCPHAEIEAAIEKAKSDSRDGVIEMGINYPVTGLYQPTYIHIWYNAKVHKDFWKDYVNCW